LHFEGPLGIVGAFGDLNFLGESGGVEVGGGIEAPLALPADTASVAHSGLAGAFLA